MNKGLLHTPEGVRDLYNEECAMKLWVQEKIHQVLHTYGYRDIQTPTFEFFDIFNKDRGSVASKNMYKFFDREGNTLVLRPDMTPSIARMASKYFMEEDMPVRLCYQGNTFINNSELQGKLKEMTIMGVECIGDDTSDADAEIVAMVADALSKAGLEEFQIEVGHVDFLEGLMEEAMLDEDTKEELLEYISSKNYFGVEELIESKPMNDGVKNIFKKLPELFGSREIINKAKNLTDNEKALNGLDRLEKLYKILEVYGLEKHIGIDLSMVSSYKYYTGIILRAYTYGTGDAIVNGGRYNYLMEQFGKKAPSVGFGIHLDQLLVAMRRQNITLEFEYENSMVLYEKNQKKAAIELAAARRKEGDSIVLVRKSSRKSIDDYQEYAKRNKISSVYYINADSQCIMLD